MALPPRSELANSIRALSMDAVQKANSGHPGMPMGMADIAEVLWNDFLRHNPQDPSWVNRDRFVLSNGHGSMLLYALLHLSGYDLSLDDLKQFRQMHSKTPGHPEYGITPGVETTTGPLGQGIANAVGMALGEQQMAKMFNRPNFDIVDHWTYAFLGDGCLMEGVSHEACSLAGTLKLGKLIAFWDDNGISIDGPVKGWFTDDTAKRFEAYGWHVISDINGHDPQALSQAILDARKNDQQPTLIACKTVIGFGAPNVQGKAACHGAPLGEDEITLAKQQLGWAHGPFEVPKEVYDAFDACARGQGIQSQWDATFAQYEKEHPSLAAEFKRRTQGQLPKGLENHFQSLIESLHRQKPKLASRKASLQVLNHIGEVVPELLGGSADLSGSNLTAWQGGKAIQDPDWTGNYLHYGVREFGMGAIMNGLALYGGFIPYGGTFLTFLDYTRNALRMAALMKQRTIYVFTHDSIGLGEDGPTHQPIEHLAMLRATPGVQTWRPADALETAVAWQMALTYDQGPTCLSLSRQTLEAQERTDAQLPLVAKGGYVLLEQSPTPQGILVATGSEVDLAIKAAQLLLEKGIRVNVVSMPCLEVFEAQPLSYQTQVLPKQVKKRLVIEAASSLSWHRIAGDQGKVLGLDRFGESAPAHDLFQFFGFTPENIAETFQQMLND